MLAATPCAPQAIWPIGCARGEEPYSAALVVRSLAHLGEREVTVVGVDADAGLIAQARGARFPACSLQNRCPGLEEVLASDLAWQGSDSFQVCNGVQQLVDFHVGEATEFAASSQIRSPTVVFVRNVLGGANASRAAELFAALHRAAGHHTVLFTTPFDVLQVDMAHVGWTTLLPGWAYSARSAGHTTSSRHAPTAGSHGPPKTLRTRS